MTDYIDKDDLSVMESYEDEIDVSETKLVSKTMHLQQMIIQFEYRLSGYSWKSNGEKLYYTGEVLLGIDSIKRVMQLLQTFSREVNMIADKDPYIWGKQLLRTSLNLIEIITTAHDIEKYSDMKIIFRSFYNLLQNIGHVIVSKNSQEFLRDYFGMTQEVKDNMIDKVPEMKGEI